METLGKRFYKSQHLCDDAFRGGKLFFKFTNEYFSAFNSIKEFTEWYTRFKKIADKKNVFIPFYEQVREGNVHAFYADIEVYMVEIPTSEEVNEIQSFIIESVEKNMKIEVPRVTNKGVWTQDHRPDAGKEGYKFKLSMHVIFNDILFIDTKKKSPMHKLAIKINNNVIEDIREKTEPLFTSLYIPDNSICLLYTSPSPRDQRGSRMPSSA